MSGNSSHQAGFSTCTPRMHSLTTPVWRRSPEVPPAPPMPTHAASPAFRVLLQLSVGTVKSPDTEVTGVADGTMYPDQLLLTGKGGLWRTSVRRTVEAFPLAPFALKVNLQCTPMARAGSLAVSLPRHLTRAGFGPDQKRGFDDRVQTFAWALDQLSFMWPP